jgi:dihydrofolate reductase
MQQARARSDEMRVARRHIGINLEQMGGTMGDVVANMSMSLAGYMEDARGGVDKVFAWLYGSGNAEVAVPGDDRKFKTSEASADHLRKAFATTGALLTGRRLFDLTHGWSGRHPVGAPVFVVTLEPPDDWSYPDAPFTFVTNGVASAVAQAKAAAGDRIVAVASADVAQQCLNLGLLDAIVVDLVPVLLGGGKPFFAKLRQLFELSTPTVVAGNGVTHLTYRVRTRA